MPALWQDPGGQPTAVRLQSACVARSIERRTLMTELTRVVAHLMTRFRRFAIFLVIAWYPADWCQTPRLDAAVYTLGSINGQNGWSGGNVAISSAVDQAVTNLDARTGA